jgi:hypothetical protein
MSKLLSVLLVPFGPQRGVGIVNPNQHPATSSTNTFGVSGGVGFTARVGAAPYRVYAEARYHYAPTENISTQLITVTVGIRY